MNDPFGHINCSKFYLEHTKKRLAKEKRKEFREMWEKSIKEQQDKIDEMEQAEITRWESFRN